MDRLRALREARGLSQFGLAAAAGVSPSTVYKYERDPTSVLPDILAKLAAALGVNAHELLAETPAELGGRA